VPFGHGSEHEDGDDGHPARAGDGAHERADQARSVGMGADVGDAEPDDAPEEVIVRVADHEP